MGAEPWVPAGLVTWPSLGVSRERAILGSGQGTSALSGSCYMGLLWLLTGQGTMSATPRSRPAGRATVTTGPQGGVPAAGMSWNLPPATPGSQHPEPVQPTLSWPAHALVGAQHPPVLAATTVQKLACEPPHVTPRLLFGELPLPCCQAKCLGTHHRVTGYVMQSRCKAMTGFGHLATVTGSEVAQ